MSKKEETEVLWTNVILVPKFHQGLHVTCKEVMWYLPDQLKEENDFDFIGSFDDLRRRIPTILKANLEAKDEIIADIYPVFLANEIRDTELRKFLKKLEKAK